MRMASVDRVEPSFVHDMLEATQFQGDEDYFATLGAQAPATVNGSPPTACRSTSRSIIWRRARRASSPSAAARPSTASSPAPRARPASSSAFGCAADALIAENDGAIAGVRLASGETLPADAAMLACGGFQANAAMMREHFGRTAASVPLLAPRAHFNSGDGIRMAQALGADLSGEPDGMHIEPVDPRAKNQAAVVLLYPYGIVVDRDGRRFFDEGAGLVHETWEAFSRRLHFEVPGRTAFAILDARVRAIPDWQRATRSEVPPFEAATLAELAKLIGVDADNARRARSRTTTPPAPAIRKSSTPQSATASPRRRRSRRRNRTGRAPSSSRRSSPGRSIGAIAYTFGGLATDTRARVLRGGAPIAGLFAAGEITGHFYGTAPNAVSVLRAFVFGRIAGREAVASLRS